MAKKGDAMLKKIMHISLICFIGVGNVRGMKKTPPPPPPMQKAEQQISKQTFNYIKLGPISSFAWKPNSKDDVFAVAGEIGCFVQNKEVSQMYTRDNVLSVVFSSESDEKTTVLIWQDTKNEINKGDRESSAAYITNEHIVYV